MYIWQQRTWPSFTWDGNQVLTAIAAARRKQGELLGAMRVLGFQKQQAALLDAMTAEAIATSRIEGEELERDAVFSSVARHLGMPEPSLGREDARAEGVVQMSVDAAHHYELPLTAQRLFRWHEGLFPSNADRVRRIRLGAWRTDVIHIVSGPYGAERVHYEAPPAGRVPEEMDRFLTWFNGQPQEDGLVRCAIAHFWFEAIHPFDDGNGRIGRAIAEMQLARDEQLADRYYSISRQISQERSAYYDALRDASTGNGDLTRWISWFLGCYVRAIGASELIVEDVINTAHFWRRHAAVEMSDRQRNVLNRFLNQFEGKLTAKKWAALAKVSPDTAQRDIADLLYKGVLAKNKGASKNTSYSVI